MDHTEDAELMSGDRTYTIYAILHELNRREFRKKLDRYPEDLHFMVTLANSIIGAENAKRVKETPEAIAADADAFVAKLLQVTNLEQADTLKGILEALLVETLQDEVRFCCPNCRNFNKCTHIVNLNIGELFKQRVQGDESDELKKEIKSRIDIALEHAPHIETDEAHTLCKEFIHQYDPSSLGEVFNRYRDIASELQQRFDADYEAFQQKLIQINMDFVKKTGAA